MPVIPYRLSLLPVFAFLVAAAPVGPPADNPKIMNDFLQCRAIVVDAARLACFDKMSGQFSDAAAHGDIRVVDKEQVNQTRRALFGFSLPVLDMFNSHTDKLHRSDENDIKEVTAKIVRIGSNRDGGYVLTLDDGSRWEQTEDVSMGRSPRSGDMVTIKRGAVGSYKISIEHGPGMKARRIS